MPAEEETDEGQAQPENHSQTMRHLYPNAMEVEAITKANKEKNKTPLPPHLPREDLKIVVRPRNGLNVSELSEAQLRDCIARATGIEPEQAADDILRASPKQNTFVISTPSVTRAEAYAKIRELPVGGASYEAMAYATPPDNTSRGVIRNIPDYDTPEDITRSLVYKKNPTILQARRLGKSSSAIILFEGGKVPFYIYYRGAEMRCYLHKKKLEICETCGKVGHKTDVCPKPETTYCKVCGMQQPPERHACEPKCALCGKGHPKGDKKCHQRFQTPNLPRRRQWEKKLRQDETDRQRRSSKGRQSHSKEQKRERSPSVTGRNRSVSFPRLPGSGNHKSRAESREDPRLLRQDIHTGRDQGPASRPTGARNTGRPPREDQSNDYRSDGGPASLPKEQTATGKHLLNSLRIPYEQTFGEKLSIPAELRKSIQVPPLPRNMHPLYNEKLRELRAQALEKQLGEDPQVVYTDAATYKRRGTMVSVVTDHSGKVLAACSIRIKHPEEGEELAIALALATTHARKVVSDSQPAIRNFAQGRILGAALRVLTRRDTNQNTRTTLHAALEGNERANEAARDLTHREPPPPGPHFTDNSRDRLCTYREVLDHYKGERRTYPAADPSLTKRQEVAENPDIQQWAVQRAEDAARSQDILALLRLSEPPDIAFRVVLLFPSDSSQQRPTGESAQGVLLLAVQRVHRKR
ncbi:hypothetical protein HPB47_025169 [Ixodes persulcatus]|uniref:Uncharacterized protein n=1 Tax=Ixodes persulcatus TaxID=34615 RepID=A0AC60Q294_IXOPE|nr:hypothetical protein HPB47_025169 [Ixodes persulcatus]